MEPPIPLLHPTIKPDMQHHFSGPNKLVKRNSTHTHTHTHTHSHMICVTIVMYHTHQSNDYRCGWCLSILQPVCAQCVAQFFSVLQCDAVRPQIGRTISMWMVSVYLSHLSQANSRNFSYKPCIERASLHSGMQPWRQDVAGNVAVEKNHYHHSFLKSERASIHSGLWWWRHGAVDNNNEACGKMNSFDNACEIPVMISTFPFPHVVTIYWPGIELVGTALSRFTVTNWVT